MESVLAQAMPIPVMESSSRYLLWIPATESSPSAPATMQMPCVRRRESARAIGCSAKEKTKHTAEYIPKHNPPHLHALRVKRRLRIVGSKHPGCHPTGKVQPHAKQSQPGADLHRRQLPHGARHLPDGGENFHHGRTPGALLRLV